MALEDLDEPVVRERVRGDAAPPVMVSAATSALTIAASVAVCQDAAPRRFAAGPRGQRQGMTVVGSLMRGAVAGAAGTAAMTAAQTAYYKATGSEPSSTPAEVGKRVIGGVLQREVPDRQESTLNTAMHWIYGTGWGALLGLAAAGRRPGAGVAFGLAVWGASLVHLPAMGLAPPVWKWEPETLASDVGFHLVYGVSAATAYKVLD